MSVKHKELFMDLRLAVLLGQRDTNGGVGENQGELEREAGEEEGRDGRRKELGIPWEDFSLIYDGRGIK